MDFNIGDCVYFIGNKDDIIKGSIKSMIERNASLVYFEVATVERPFPRILKVLNKNLYHSWGEAKNFINERDERKICSLCEEIKTPEKLIEFCIAKLEDAEGLEIETEVIKRKAKEFFKIGEDV